jgi:hypothetical protein
VTGSVAGGSHRLRRGFADAVSPRFSFFVSINSYRIRIRSNRVEGWGPWLSGAWGGRTAPPRADTDKWFRARTHPTIIMVTNHI